MKEILVVAQLASTFVLFGVICAIQLVQYPSFTLFASANFIKYHAAHSSWITPIVAPAMFAELISSILILIYSPQNLDIIWFWLGLILTLIGGLSTVFVQVPVHNRFAQGFDLESINW